MNLMGFLRHAKAGVCALVFVFSGTAQAQIPVTDIAHIALDVASQIETIAQWTQQFNQMKQQIDQYKQQFDAITGSRGMGALLDNPVLKSALPSDWQQVLSSVKKTSAYITERAKYPTILGLPKTNAMYDLIASQNATMTDLYTKANDRLSQIQSLMGQIDSANDPAAKADLANRLINEQNAIQANQNLVTILQSRLKQELEMAGQSAAKEFSCKEFKRSNC